MKATGDLATKQAMWAEFLLAVSGIYSMLKAGAKGNGWSGAWVARKLQERHDDPLLSYLHHARDAEEHGIEAVTDITNSNIQLPPGSWAVFAATGPNEWTVVG